MEQFAILVFSTLLWFCLGLYWGYQYALHHHQIPDVESVNKYIQKNFPNQWAAYQKGVFEGYEQGLKDGRTPPL
jgi:hypothetical protein